MRLNHLLEKVYYEPERPSALGDVNKFYRAARRYGVQRSQVLYTDLQENTFATSEYM